MKTVGIIIILVRIFYGVICGILFALIGSFFSLIIIYALLGPFCNMLHEHWFLPVAWIVCSSLTLIGFVLGFIGGVSSDNFLQDIGI